MTSVSILRPRLYITFGALLPLAALLWTGCEVGSDDPTPPGLPVTTSRQILTSGGKRTLCVYWVWSNESDAYEVRARWLAPDGDPHKCLGGAARVAALARGNLRNALPAPSAAIRSTQAFFAGGVGPNGEFASDQAYFYDAPSDSWRGLAMSVPRAGHTVTALANGRALIAGGSNGLPPFAPLDSAELFDPVAVRISGTGTLRTARERHAASLLLDGRVLVTGGVPAEASMGAEIYDPSSGEFTTIGAMSTPRANHLSIALDDGRVLICGSNAVLAAEVFDPLGGGFSGVGDMNAEHGAGATATKLNSGHVLVLGGFDSRLGYISTSAAELFDPSTNQFTRIDDMTVARREHSATLQADGTVMIAGGIIADGSTVASSEIFHPTTRRFVPAPAMPYPGSDHASVLLSTE